MSMIADIQNSGRSGGYSGHIFYLKESQVIYLCTIWKNFRGMTFQKFVNGKKVYGKHTRGKFDGMDYATGYVYLKAHFSIK